ncbi:ABC transporter ATP-binding protein [Chromatium okenii]|uniref:ABC transporter ATP-binding protein n=1 Tax=Chromatium okenii TaxID=61644 RepID=UPI0026EB0B46|nr:ABC transporter ATP-binding protein [Chromatium okenii]MBV5307917.1 ABC transporter ATP-binding protein [Chromatium okenii]
MTAPLLQIEGLTTDIGAATPPLRVIAGVDLTVNAGETLALVGESGCGKSLTALSLMRLLPPAAQIVAGAVRLGGMDLLRLTEAEMRGVRGGQMAMIFQEPQTALNPVLTVGAQIAEALKSPPTPLLQRGASSFLSLWQKGQEGFSKEGLFLPPLAKGGRGGFETQVIDLLQAVGIPDPALRLHDYPHQLSGGMKQRVMIALALAGHPQLLIADEPTTALDVTIQAQVLRLLKTLQRDTGMALLLITHDLGVVAETADRLAVMYAGQIIETAPVADFFAAPAHPYSRRLLESLPSAAQREHRLAMIPGRVPPLDTDFTGCRFADRCAEVQEICHTTPPPWRMRNAEHGARCHFVDSAQSAVDGQQLGVGSDSSAISAPAPLLQLTDLQVHFPIQRGLLRRTVGQIKAVDGVTLALAAGQTLALVGESGCGKTTVGKAILQLLAPTGGTICYGEQDLSALTQRQLRPLRKEIQIIFQDPFAAMNPRLLVGDVIGEGLLALGIAPRRADRERRVAELLTLVGLDTAAANRYPHEFSGGQRQRICIARALAVEPRILICDEPTSALDVSVQAQILNLLKDLQERLGLAYLFITHNLSVVAYLADAVAVMYLGRIVEQGAVADLLTDPRHPYTRALLSAVPVIDPAQRRTIIRLDGEMPSPRQPPSGCHFHPRCPDAVPDCARAYPEIQRFGAGRQVRCFRANVSS